MKEVCEILAYMVKEKDPNGFDVQFTGSNERKNFKHTSGLDRFLEKKRQNGTTDIEIRLNNIFEDFKSSL